MSVLRYNIYLKNTKWLLITSEAYQLCFGCGSERLAGIYTGDEGGPLIHFEGSEAKCIIGVASFSLMSQDGAFMTSVFTPVTKLFDFTQKSTALFSRFTGNTKCEISK